jgi:carbon monoxide dehydrogenase subunit G
VSSYRQQFYLDAPIESVWELVGDPRRHVQWWPEVIEMRGERFEEGDEYVQVSRVPLGKVMESAFIVDRRDELRDIRVMCQKTGRYADWELAEAQDGTFIDVTFGLEPRAFGYRLFDRTAGKVYMRRWLTEAVDGLRAAASSRSRARAENAG